ncbi:MAG: sialate O-acetylesterase, partial [Bacteroidota bacterium]
MDEIRKIIEEVEASDDRTYAKLSYDDSDWGTMTVPIHFHNTDIAGFQGISWMRKHFTLTKAQSKEDLELVLGRIEQGDKTYVNGELVGETYQTHAERRYPVSRKLLRAGDNVIAIRVKHMRNAGGGIYDGPLQLLQAGREIQGLGGIWKYNHTLEHNFPFDAKVYPHIPGTLFNAMVAPVIPFAIKGAIWYQGESNASRAYQYREIFPAMIHDWRTRWEQGHFPFFFVQLANFLETKPEPSTDPWPELREAQRETLKL